MKAILMLEDGTFFEGVSCGVSGTVVGEIVFNTSMTGYQEVLTDPSNYGQIVAMTYPFIGNYGVNSTDCESFKVQVKGLITREICDYPNSWRSDGTLNDYLTSNNTVCISGIDTRKLTRILREKGTMNGVISTELKPDHSEWLEKARTYRISNSVEKVATTQIKHFKGNRYRIALLDMGTKRSIINAFTKRECEVFVFPPFTSSEVILAIEPDGIVISGGPGDPKDCGKAVDNICRLIGKKPIFGIELGHQLTALAIGADTGKLKYGHRGNNHPVKDIRRDITFSTSQNHGFEVHMNSINKTRVEVTHISMNDGTVEGLRCTDMPVVTASFSPDTSPGTSGKVDLVEDFLTLIKNSKN